MFPSLRSSFLPNTTFTLTTKTKPPKLKFLIRATTIKNNNNYNNNNNNNNNKCRVVLNSLRVLEWDKLCDAVSSFAGTSLGKIALKEQLWKLDQTYEESLGLLQQTNAAVDISRFCTSLSELSSINTSLVTNAISRARRDVAMNGREAIAIVVMLEFAEALQKSFKTATKGSADMLEQCMPLSELILNWPTNTSLVKSIQRVVDIDGSVKDSASPRLKQARSRVSDLETKLSQLMKTLIAIESNKSSLEATKIGGRWCIMSRSGQLTNSKGLLLSSGSGNIIEPVSAVPLNDQLLEAKASVAEAEAEVLLLITRQIKVDLDGIAELLKRVVELDVVNARARYGLAVKGTCPDLLQLDDVESLSPKDKIPYSTGKQWKLFLPKSYHPLLIQQHKRTLQEAKGDLAKATSEFGKKMYVEYNQQDIAEKLQMLQERVTQLENMQPVAVDFLIDKTTRVLLITGPNTGGKTLSLKSVGLAAIMAKSGLYVLCSEPARIPWFDNVFADIGDEQSLSQSLSTFSGHLRQINDIQDKSTSQSLVLLDEVGAGTNPLEGAALGMSVLESFAEAGALLTIATTHHGELKTLKYSSDGFENACMEFDDVKLKPTYKILWGIPGRSNAINIAERLGLPKVILDDARKLYGAASAEIDEVIYELEKFKQDVEEYINRAQHYIMLSKNLRGNIIGVQENLNERSRDLRYKKMQDIEEYASMASSTLHMKLQQYRESARRSIQAAKKSPPRSPIGSRDSASGSSILSTKTKSTAAAKDVKQSSSAEERKISIPKVGDMVQVASLRTKVKVLKVEAAKEEILVQAGFLKLKFKFSDIVS